ncbi:MAG TPA: ubiquitin-activating E1 FCCH domain-containing protein, partial [Lacunisphaera sp.]|nr:ubiquitin-activating E1 FCCH domain-containing protein [Lacunisphaera sp.]
MRRFTDLLERFRRDERGAFLVIFAILAIVLIATSGAVVDFTYTQTARSRAQTALDAAALAMEDKVNEVNDGTTTKDAAEADVMTKAQQILDERLADNAITATVNSATIDTTAGTLDIRAQITVPTSFVQLVGIHSITAQLTSQATRGSKDIEVSVALDTTGSMAGQKILDLQNATDWLIDHVVQDVQTPTYSKMAIVPWSAAVNVGTYANEVRGTPIAGTAITAASWTNGSASIKAVTKANPGVVTTTAAHGFADGNIVYISGVKGMTELNGNTYMVKNPTSTTFQLYTTAGVKVNTSGYTTYSKNGTIQRCTLSTCEITITSNAHGLSAGDNVYITGVTGLSSPLNINGVQTVGAVTTNSFVWSGSFGPTETAYSSGGTAYCVKYGCTYYYFTNTSGTKTLYKANNCATER